MRKRRKFYGNFVLKGDLTNIKKYVDVASNYGIQIRKPQASKATVVAKKRTFLSRGKKFRLTAF